MPVVQRSCGATPRSCVLEQFSITIGPVPLDRVTYGQEPCPADLHLFRRICVPVKAKSHGAADEVWSTVCVMEMLSSVIRLPSFPTLTLFTPSTIAMSR